MNCSIYLDIPNKEEQFLKTALVGIKITVIDYLLQNQELLNAVVNITALKKPVKDGSVFSKRAKDKLPVNLFSALQGFIRASGNADHSNFSVLSAYLSVINYDKIVFIYRCCLPYEGSPKYTDYEDISLIQLSSEEIVSVKSITNNLNAQRMDLVLQASKLKGYFAKLEELGERAEKIRQDYRSILKML